MRYNGTNGSHTHGNGRVKSVPKFTPQDMGQLKQRAQSSAGRLVSLGKESLAQEDYTEAERYFQSAEHYIRQLNGIEARERKESKNEERSRQDEQFYQKKAIAENAITELEQLNNANAFDQRTVAKDQKNEELDRGSFEFPIESSRKEEKGETINSKPEWTAPRIKSLKRERIKPLGSGQSVQDSRSREEVRTTHSSQEFGGNLVVRKRRIVRKRVRPAEVDPN